MSVACISLPIFWVRPSVSVAFMVFKEVLGQVFLLPIWFCPVQHRRKVQCLYMSVACISLPTFWVRPNAVSVAFMVFKEVLRQTFFLPLPVRPFRNLRPQSCINHLRCVMLATVSVVNNTYKMCGGVGFYLHRFLRSALY